MALLPISALLLGVLLELILARVLSPRGKGWLAFASSLVALGGVAAVWPSILRGETLDFRLLSWDGPAALAYHVDGLSLLFALMAAGIGAAVLLYSVAYMAKDKGATRFYALMLLFIAGLIHLVYSADLIVLYLSWEVIGLCSFLLVGFWYQQKEAAAGARKVLVMTHLAGYGLLAAILLLYARTGTTLWTDPRMAGSFSTGLFLLMLLAAVAKSVQFPLHTWIPDAMAAPTPVSSLLHAACYVKAGVYLIARMHSLGAWQPDFQLIVIWIGTITMLVGVLYALVQSDLKRLLAFHTVSQIGYMVLGLGLGTPLGIAAGLLHCLNHGLFKGGLFLCAGAVERETGTRDLDRLGGLARRMPLTTTSWLILAGSIAGVPLLSGFVSKWLLFNAALEARQTIPALVSWIVSVLTVFSFLKATGGAFLGNETADTSRAHETDKPMWIGSALLAGGSLLLGIVPQVAIALVINPLLPALGVSPTIDVSWLGLNIRSESWFGSGSWFATGGLILAFVAVGAGVFVYWLSQPVRRMVAAGATAGGIFTGGEPLSGGARLPASDFSLIVKQGLAPFYQWVDVDRYYLALWRGLIRLCEWLGKVNRQLERNAIAATLALTCLMIAIVFAAEQGIAPALVSTPHANVGTPLLIGIGLSLAALLFAATIAPQTRRALPLMLVAGLLALLGLVAEDPAARPVLLELASITALVLVWRTAASRDATSVYLLAVLLSAGLVVGGMLGLNILPPAFVLAVVLAGFVLKLALVPLYLWLPRVAEAAPASVVGLVIAVVDVSAFGELLALRQSAPWLFAPVEIWLALALLSAFGGAVLMLAQRDVKRMLAFSTIEDMGFLTLGIVSAGTGGLAGATIGVIVHSLAKALLFSSVSVVERQGTVTLASGGLTARFPIAGAGFLIGALAVLGVPPLAGYAARWRLYGAAAEMSPLALVILLLASALAVLAYARVITLCWWGPGEKERQREPVAAAAAIVGLSIVLLLLGLAPGLMGG